VRAALLGEKLMDVIGIVAAGGGGRRSQGFAADVSHCLNLCKLTRNIVQRSDVADMLTQSLRLQCGEREAHAAKREDFSIVRMAGHPDQDVGNIYIAWGTTQLIRAALLNNLPRVLQLIQLGAPLDLVDESEHGYSALHWACSEGYEHVAKALLAGKFEGKGATVDLPDKSGRTPLMSACLSGHVALVRLLIENGANQVLQDEDGHAALHYALDWDDNLCVVALLLAAPGAAAALVLKMKDPEWTPLKMAIINGHTACEAALRAAGAEISSEDLLLLLAEPEDE
jgi:ankyrin repeat protein